MADANKPPIDWEAVEIQYRAGIRSLKDIGAEFGVSDAGILKRAKRDGWARDLKAKIRAKAEAKVSAATVSAEVSALTKINEAVTIEVEAEVQARVLLRGRKDIGQARELAMKLLDELRAQTDNGHLFDQLAELLIDPEGDEDASSAAKERQRKRMEVFQAALSLGSRTKVMKDLGDTLKTLIALEREAFGIDERRGGPQSGDISISF